MAARKMQHLNNHLETVTTLTSGTIYTSSGVSTWCDWLIIVLSVGILHVCKFYVEKVLDESILWEINENEVLKVFSNLKEEKVTEIKFVGYIIYYVTENTSKCVENWLTPKT